MLCVLIWWKLFFLNCNQKEQKFVFLLKIFWPYLIKLCTHCFDIDMSVSGMKENRKRMKLKRYFYFLSIAPLRNSFYAKRAKSTCLVSLNFWYKVRTNCIRNSTLFFFVCSFIYFTLYMWLYLRDTLVRLPFCFVISFFTVFFCISCAGVQYFLFVEERGEFFCRFMKSKQIINNNATERCENI